MAKAQLVDQAFETSTFFISFRSLVQHVFMFYKIPESLAGSKMQIRRIALHLRQSNLVVKIKYKKLLLNL